MIQHEYLWSIMGSWCIMSTHEAAWVLKMHHKYLDYSFLGPKSGTRFVTKWDAIEVERISTIQILMIFRRASLNISRLSGFHFFVFWSCIIIILIIHCFFGSIQDHPGSIQGPPRINLEASCGLQGPFCVEVTSDFSRNSQFMKNRLSSVSRDSVRRTSEQSMWNWCPVIFQPSIYIKNSPYAAPAAVMLQMCIDSLTVCARFGFDFV